MKKPIFVISSPVVRGKMLGHTIGIPTANQQLDAKNLPSLSGIYASVVELDGGTYIGVSNIGTRPTIKEGDDHIPNCETYILDFEGDLYGKKITVSLYKKLREEKAFPSIDALCKEIQKNALEAREYFKSHDTENT